MAGAPVWTLLRRKVSGGEAEREVTGIIEAESVPSVAEVVGIIECLMKVFEGGVNRISSSSVSSEGQLVTETPDTVDTLRCSGTYNKVWDVLLANSRCLGSGSLLTTVVGDDFIVVPLASEVTIT